MKLFATVLSKPPLVVCTPFSSEENPVVGCDLSPQCPCNTAAVPLPTVRNMPVTANSPTSVAAVPALNVKEQRDVSAVLPLVPELLPIPLEWLVVSQFLIVMGALVARFIAQDKISGDDA